MHIPRAWKIALAVGGVCLALVMSTVLGTAAVERRVIGPPQFIVTIGPARLAGFVTRFPNCRAPRRVNSTVMCGASQSINAGGDEYYAVWLTLRSRRGTVPYEQADRLLLLHLSEGPPDRRR
jgi:hypothetical protein